MVILSNLLNVLWVLLLAGAAVVSFLRFGRGHALAGAGFCCLAVGSAMSLTLTVAVGRNLNTVVAVSSLARLIGMAGVGLIIAAILRRGPGDSPARPSTSPYAAAYPSPYSAHTPSWGTAPSPPTGPPTGPPAGPPTWVPPGTPGLQLPDGNPAGGSGTAPDRP